MALLCFSCTDGDMLSGVAGDSPDAQIVQFSIDITTPEAFSTTCTRAITEENDAVLDGNFLVFAFDNDQLLYYWKTGDTNGEETNLKDASNAWGDYTDSLSITWHAADESQSSGRLYIEAKETPKLLHLFVLANVDVDKVSALFDGEEPAISKDKDMSEEAVIAALSPALDFDVAEVEYIPMVGECDLEDGITLGSKGSLSLRRSVAKFTVRVEYTVARLNADYEGDIEKAPFLPSEAQILNLNAYATVYAPSTDEPNVSSLNEAQDRNPSLTFLDEWTQGTNNDGEEVYYKEVVFYVAETENNRSDAYSGGEWNTDNPRISVLVGGQFEDYDSQTLDENWYRLDLIPESATSTDQELESILRNHHYRFILGDVVDRGSSSKEEALELTVPDNFPFGEGDNDNYVEIVDEDILSVTVEYYTSTDSDEPYYIGVSSTSIELEDTEDACARVKVDTNFDDWHIDESSIPVTDDGNYVISFVYDAEAKTLWLWLDYPDAVTPGETYYYYIVAGNIRKKMRVTIVKSDT